MIGTSTFGFGGWQYFLVLILFFLSSSGLTKYKSRQKTMMGLVSEVKSGARDIWQTIGQGGVGVATLILATSYPRFWMPLTLAFVSSIGEANADTWAVEIGILSRKKPRLITGLKREVSPGTSGGVTVLGETAALLGAAFIATIATVFGIGDGIAASVLLVCVSSAFLGEHIDSLLGATVQAVYYCSKCKKETERRIHKCGTKAELRRGAPIISNELVNVLSTGSAAAISLILSRLVFGL
jgi:uncharacterized protein (TIGR00297 family)